MIEVFSLRPLKDMLKFMVAEVPEEMKAFIQEKGEEWIKMKEEAYKEAKEKGQTPY